MPVELGVGARGIEHEVASFVCAGVGGELPLSIAAPELCHAFDDPLNGLGVVFGGAEVEGCGVARGIVAEQFFG